VIEFLELESSDTEFDELNNPKITPTGENLLVNGIINVTVDSVETNYGIKITNNSPWDLYPAVFYFDNSDWSVSECIKDGDQVQAHDYNPERYILPSSNERTVRLRPTFTEGRQFFDHWVWLRRSHSLHISLG
jgi:hypothetical protein